MEADFQKEMAALAHEYGCDPKDPIFAVLVAIAEVRADLKAVGNQAGTFGATGAALQHTVGKFASENEKAAKLAVRFAEITTASGKTKAREKFQWAVIGAGIALLAGMTTMSLLVPVRAIARLSGAGVGIITEGTKQGTRITLTGKRIVHSGQSDTAVVVEFGER